MKTCSGCECKTSCEAPTSSAWFAIAVIVTFTVGILALMWALHFLIG